MAAIVALFAPIQTFGSRRLVSRLCLCPGGCFIKALHPGEGSMATYADDAGGTEWKDAAHKFFRNVVGVIDEYEGLVAPDSAPGVILADIRFGAMALAEQIVRGDREAALRVITGLRESISDLLRGTD